MNYKAPITDMQFLLFEVLKADPFFEAHHMGQQDVRDILEQAAVFCCEQLEPLNPIGDKMGCSFENGRVITPAGFKEAYEAFYKLGWGALAAHKEYGGQQLPFVLNQCLYEMVNSCNQAWGMYPGLTQGAYECVHAHGTEQQKKMLLPHFVSGRFSGTMCLTEPHCGTDLSLIKTRAKKVEDTKLVESYLKDSSRQDLYQIQGHKIFISSGEHDCSQNIIHLVLAQESEGLSLFIVPRVWVYEDGSLGGENAVKCIGLEHKMGIHGNATSQLVFESAMGVRLGASGRGLQNMFVMMNAARIGVGGQSLGLMQRGYQRALEYAQERRQMRSADAALRQKGAPADPIIVHPAVKKALLEARTMSFLCRALTYWSATLIDAQHNERGADESDFNKKLLGLLTPMVKAFNTDVGFSVLNDCLQVFGGHGYIQEYGVEQLVRDSRINQIYEGTNGIQALDLLYRKVLLDEGKTLTALGLKIAALLQDPSMHIKGAWRQQMGKALLEVQQLTAHIGASQSVHQVGSSAAAYLHYVSYVLCGYLALQCAGSAQKLLSGGSLETYSQEYLQGVIDCTDYFFTHLFVQTSALYKKASAPIDAWMNTPLYLEG